LLSEVQKELEKAKAYESTGNYDKAARSYFKLATTTSGEQSVKLYNKAFFTSRKSANTHLMYSIGKTYYDILLTGNQDEKIDELIPTFLEITGRMRDQQAGKSLEEVIDVLNWSITLYNSTGNTNASFEVSMEVGDKYFSSGQELLTSSHRTGKEEKWQKGLNLFTEAIDAYKQIRLDKEAFNKVLDVKLELIEKLIDIGRHKEGIENTSELLSYFSSQKKEIQPFSKNDLTFKISQILATKSLEKARDKKFDVANALQHSAKAGFESSGNSSNISPFLWSLSQIYDENNQKKLFFELVENAFEASLKYENETTQSSISDYLQAQGMKISENIINSRMLMVKKGSIEFNNHEGLQYFLKSIDLAKKIDNNDIPDKITKYIFQYAQTMYEKKLKSRSLPYFEFCSQIWWGLPNGQNNTKNIILFLEKNYDELLDEGKCDDAANHLNSILSIKTFIGNIEEVGDSALSFAQFSAQQAKVKHEIDFIERAYDAYSSISSKDKLQSLLDYVIQRLDPLFSQESKSKELRERYLELGTSIATNISQEVQGEFLQASAIKSINSRLIENGIELAEKAFTVQKKYNPQLAADLYFKVGSLIIETHMQKGTEFIINSIKFSAENDSLKDVVDRNLNFLMETTLSSEQLSTKLFFIDEIDKITESIDQQASYHEFLLRFTKNLGNNVSDPDYYVHMKSYLEKTFTVYYNKDKKHNKLEEILTWTNSHIIENYKEKKNESLYEMTLLNMEFHEKTERSKEFIDFFWQAFETFISSEDFSHAIELYKTTDQFCDRLKLPSTVQQEIAEKVVTDLNNNLKPKIKNQKFDEAWQILEGLFTILINRNLKVQALTLYQNNAVLFANTRLDLALSMWSQAIEVIKTLEDSKSLLLSISAIITEEVIPTYIEKNITPAVNQLYSQAVNINELAGETELVQEVILKATRHQLTIGDYSGLLDWGIKGFKASAEVKSEKYLQEYSNMFFAIGRGLLTENPKVGINLITTASEQLRQSGSFGYDQYCIKISEIYEDLYKNPETLNLAQDEREKVLQHFKKSGNKKEEGKFLLRTGKLAIETNQFREGLNLIQKATGLFQEIEDQDELAEVVSYCLKTATNFGIGSSQYKSLSNQATKIQEGGVEFSEEKTQDAFGDLFDGMLEDMTSLMDPKKRMKRRKGKK